MKCNHCGSQWTTTVENYQSAQNCPFCGKPLGEATADRQNEAKGKFIIVENVLVQFLGGPKDVVIPDGVVRLGPGAFRGYGVESVHIPDGVTAIDDNCFHSCSLLRRVRIPASVTSISDSAFRDTKNVKIIADKGTYAWNKYAKPAPAAPAKPAPAAPAKPAPVAPAKPAPAAPAQTGSETKLPQSQTDQQLVWAQLLGCEPGERPWMMKVGIFGRAKKLINRIKTVTDQQLLMRIATEAPLLNVASAAVGNITDQKMLEQLALSDKDSTIRCGAIRRLDHQQLLFKLALEDEDFFVREAAAARLPDNDKRARLLRAAASVSRGLSVYNMPRFQQAAANLVDLDPGFLQQVLKNYPCDDVCYMTREILGYRADSPADMESRLRAQTPSAQIIHCKKLCKDAGSVTSSFAISCKMSAEAGRRSCEEEFQLYYESHGDAYDVAGLVRESLEKRGFSRAKVSVVCIQTEPDERYGLEISASW